MSRTLTAAQLYEQFSDRLELSWVAGRESAASREITAASFHARPSLVGFLNLIHPNRVQILGNEENQWLDNLDAKNRWETVARIFDARPAALIVSGGLPVAGDLEESARESDTPLLTTPRPAWEIVAFLEYQVARALARRTTLHGVFMEVFTIGVLITGDPGTGKSELALELLTRGHRLIADDAPEFTQITPDIIDGTCPAVVRDNLEVRGLGVLNIRRMFGDATIKANKFLRLIIHLQMPDASDQAAPTTDRLRGDGQTRKVLDLEIPQINLPVLPGRNLAVIVEAAVRDFILRMQGFDAASEFVERHRRLVQGES